MFRSWRWIGGLRLCRSSRTRDTLEPDAADGSYPKVDVAAARQLRRVKLVERRTVALKFAKLTESALRDFAARHAAHRIDESICTGKPALMERSSCRLDPPKKTAILPIPVVDGGTISSIPPGGDVVEHAPVTLTSSSVNPSQSMPRCAADRQMALVCSRGSEPHSGCCSVTELERLSRHWAADGGPGESAQRAAGYLDKLTDIAEKSSQAPLDDDPDLMRIISTLESLVKAMGSDAKGVCWDVEVSRRVQSLYTCLALRLLRWGCRCKKRRLHGAVSTSFKLLLTGTRIFDLVSRRETSRLSVPHHTTRHMMEVIARLSILDVQPQSWRHAQESPFCFVPREDAAHEGNASMPPAMCIMDRLPNRALNTLVNVAYLAAVTAVTHSARAETPIGRSLAMDSSAASLAMPLTNCRDPYLGALCRRVLVAAHITPAPARGAVAGPPSSPPAPPLPLPAVAKLLYAMSVTHTEWPGTRTGFQLVRRHLFHPTDSSHSERLDPRSWYRTLSAFAELGIPVELTHLKLLRDANGRWFSTGLVTAAEHSRFAGVLDRIHAKRSHRQWRQKLKEKRRETAGGEPSTSDAPSARSEDLAKQLDSAWYDEIDIVQVVVRRADPYTSWGFGAESTTMQCYCYDRRSMDPFEQSGIEIDTHKSRPRGWEGTDGGERIALLARLLSVNGAPVKTTDDLSRVLFGQLTATLEIARLQRISDGTGE